MGHDYGIYFTFPSVYNLSIYIPSFICSCDVIVILFFGYFLSPTGPGAFGRRPRTFHADGRPTRALCTLFSRRLSGQYLERGLRVWIWVNYRVMDTIFVLVSVCLVFVMEGLSFGSPVNGKWSTTECFDSQGTQPQLQKSPQRLFSHSNKEQLQPSTDRSTNKVTK